MNRWALLISVASLGLFGSSAVLARSATVENIRTPHSLYPESFFRKGS